MACFYALLMLLAVPLAAPEQIHHAVETEMFAIPISPNMFNWTYQEFDQQYRFHASLVGKPELPSWLRYIYSGRHHSGFIFGTPPRGTKSSITLEVIGLNRQDYETRRLLLGLNIHNKDKLALHEVEMKIDNLNVEDLLDEHRMTRLKDIFRSKLWVESSQDLYTTFLASAIDLGARLPLKPNEGEGLVVRFGSSKPFSIELKRLREEVRPLSRLPSCPREYKRTTVERLFRDAGLTLDWCSFELFNTVYKERSTELHEYLSEVPKTKPDNTRVNYLESQVWSAPSKYDLPVRSYMKEFTVAVIVPVILMLVSVAALTAVLCFHYAGIAHKSSRVELCRYETNNTEQTHLPDNSSNKSIGISPNNSLARPYSPKSTTNLAGSYNRPQPPPYMGSTSNTLHHRKSGNTDSDPGHTPEHRGHIALEESLKLLNEAKLTNAEYINNMSLKLDGKIPILKDQVVDFNDGSDDYVPIKSDAGYVSMRTDLDDIVVPELSQYGLGGVASNVI